MWRNSEESELERAVPEAEQVVRHARVVDAPPERVWQALTTLATADLPLARWLMTVRGGGKSDLADGALLTNGPVPAQVFDPPHYVLGVKAHRPWAHDELDPPLTVGDAPSFDTPAWVVTGTDFRLEPRPDGRTLLTSQTRCRSTSARARRRMRGYWTAIRPFNGLIRREMLRAIARKAERSAPR